MIWVFPMAGRGLRTSELGPFKPFIQVGRRKIVAWMLHSIRKNIRPNDRLIFVTTESYARTHDVRRVLEEILVEESVLNRLDLLTVPETPPGPSATVYAAKASLMTDEPVIAVNCDQYIDFDLMDIAAGRQGFLPVYAHFGNKSSFVKVEKDIITLIVEKRNISGLASAGIYAVSTGSALIRAIEAQFERGQSTNGEFYVGVALNNLIEEGYKFHPLAVRAKYDLGDVQEIAAFEQTIAVMCESE